MQSENLPDLHALWPSWASFLRRLRLENLAAWALEAAGPLAALSAQLLYIGEPLLCPAFPQGRVGALARLLEDDDETQAFAAFLREDERA